MNKDVKIDEGAFLALKNAKSLFAAAQSLSESNNYGLATSTLILSGEEAMKSISIFTKSLMDENNLKEYEKTDYKKIFSDHKFKLNSIRSTLGFVSIIEASINYLIIPIINAIDNDNYESVGSIRKVGFANFLSFLRNEASDKNTSISKENAWWMKANNLKQKGFYVNKSGDKWESPENIKEENFLEGKKHVIRLLKIAEMIDDIQFDDIFTIEQIHIFNSKFLPTYFNRPKG